MWLLLILLLVGSQKGFISFLADQKLFWANIHFKPFFNTIFFDVLIQQAMFLEFIFCLCKFVYMQTAFYAYGTLHSYLVLFVPKYREIARTFCK